MYVGKRVIVGLTIIGADGAVIEQRQLVGVISRCDPTAGIVISFDTDEGDHLSLPFDVDALVTAAPGIYSLASNCVDVENPDFLTSWVIRQDAQGAWHAAPDRALRRDCHT